MPPATPTNTPRGHPLAPNPHTSIGLFWIYTDPNTGRQWTGGTYKVKRSTGAGTTPTTVIASGLTNADYQDTGLSANTTYCYRIVANDGSDSGDSPTVEVTTTSAADGMVHFPDSTWANLLGPQPEKNTIPFPWYSTTVESQGLTLITKYPVVAPCKLLGSGSINNGSSVLTGTGTKFREQVAANNPYPLNHIAINGIDAGTIASVDSDTLITLTSSWSSSNQTGVVLTTNVSGVGGIYDPLTDYVIGNQLMYYDSPMALWQVYFRSGDPRFLRGAIQGSESVFAGLMWLGRNRGWYDFSTSDSAPVLPPRNFQFSGWALLGVAGHNGVWDLLDKYLTDFYPAWISNYRGGNNNFTYVREKAYMILFTSWFVLAAPDSFPRSNGTTTSLNGSTTVDGSLASGRKGYWRDQLNLDVPGFITDDQFPSGFWLDIGGSNSTGDGDYPYFQTIAGEFCTGPAQPFIQGLTADALGYCWRTAALSTAARNAARRCVLRSAAAIGHIAYNTNVIPNNTSCRHRALWYFNEGGNRLNPFAFQHGADSYVMDNIPYSNSAKLNREANPLALSTFGWAWEMGGDPWYKNTLLEMMNASFAEVGENAGGTGDGLKCLADNTANWKSFGQCYRTSGRAYGHYLASASALSTPPVVTMPANITLTGGINQALLSALVSSSNTPVVYRWVLKEFALVNNPRHCVQPVFTDKTALSTKLCGLEPGIYKIVFYAVDSLGLQGNGSVLITVGDGVFPPTGAIGYGDPPAEEMSQYYTTSSTLNGGIYAYSKAGRSLTHALTATKPKDKSAPTITPSGSTGNHISFSVSGLSAGVWSITDTITDSAGAVRKAIMYIRHTDETQPSAGHNTIPGVSQCVDHVLPDSSTSTRLFVVPLDPEGICGYTASASGYFPDFNGGVAAGARDIVGPLTHAWSQISGPTSAVITYGDTIRPDISGLTVAGVYVFRYTGTDQQGDVVTADVSVTVTGEGGGGGGGVGELIAVAM
jgi:hypothetical protein